MMHKGKKSKVTDLELVRLHVEKRQSITMVAAIVDLSVERVRQRLRCAGVSREESEAIRNEKSHTEFVCDNCGTKKKVINSRGKQRRFCSRACAGRKILYTKPELLAHMVNLSKELKRTPGARDIAASGGPNPSTYIARFGSITKAQKAAGLPTNKVGAPRRRQ